MKSNAIILGIILFIGVSSGCKTQTKSVYIEGNDQMKFTVEEIRAQPGQTIEITLKTVSNLPKAQMAHNWVLLKKDTDVQAFISEGQQHSDNEYLAPSFENQIIALTGMLGADEQETITFTAPNEKGEYMYVCTFPGHYAAGMKGKLIVE